MTSEVAFAFQKVQMARIFLVGGYETSLPSQTVGPRTKPPGGAANPPGKPLQGCLARRALGVSYVRNRWDESIPFSV
jgi:hypothetical protein